MQTLKQPRQREKWEGGWGIDSIKAFNPAVFYRPPGQSGPSSVLVGGWDFRK